MDASNAAIAEAELGARLTLLPPPVFPLVVALLCKVLMARQDGTRAGVAGALVGDDDR